MVPRLPFKVLDTVENYLSIVCCLNPPCANFAFSVQYCMLIIDTGFNVQGMDGYRQCPQYLCYSLSSDTATLSSVSFLCLSSLGMEDQPSTRCLMELYDV